MSSSMQSADQRPEFEILACKIHSLINNGKVTCLKREFEGVSKGRRCQIVNHRINKKSALFVACEKENIPIIGYLVKHCGADMEQRGHYTHLPFHFEDEVPPLWAATEKDSLVVVQTLTNLGANINCTSSTNGTALLVGCLHNSEKSVRYLIEQGALVNVPNIYGVTPLLNASSKGSLELCKFLIANGVDINWRDNSGRNSLHRALEEKRLDVVKLLLKVGVDTTAKNDSDENVLRHASLKGCEDIVNYMIETLTLPASDIIEAYELLGSYCIIETNEYDEGCKYWEKSIDIRKKHNLQKTRSDGRLGLYTDFKEFNCMGDLQSCVMDKEMFNMQALLIRERILGTSHTETVWTMDYCGAVYADTNHYQKCINIWKLGYKLLLEKNDGFNEDGIFRIQALMKVFLDNLEDYEKSVSTEQLSTRDVLDVFDLLLINIRQGKTVFAQRPWDKDTPKRFQTLMIMALQMIKLLTRLEKTGEEIKTYHSLVVDLVRINPLDECNRCLLHLAFCPLTGSTDEYVYHQFPCAVVGKTLIACGADVNHMDHVRDTPLLYCARLLGDKKIEKKSVNEMIRLMLDVDAHIDIYNHDGQCALNLLLKHGFSFCPMNHQTLKCCAATVIMQNRVLYRECVPKSLISFIEYHGKCFKENTAFQQTEE